MPSLGDALSKTALLRRVLDHMSDPPPTLVSQLGKLQTGLQQRQEKLLKDFGFSRLSVIEQAIHQLQDQRLHTHFNTKTANAAVSKANRMRTSPQFASTAINQLAKAFDLDNTTLKLAGKDIPTIQGLQGFNKAGQALAGQKATKPARFAQSFAYAAFMAGIELKKKGELEFQSLKFLQKLQPKAISCNFMWKYGETVEQCLAQCLVDDGVASRQHKLSLQNDPIIGAYFMEQRLTLFTGQIQ